MYYYACPYCSPPSIEACLLESKIMEVQCDHKKPFFNKDRECKKDEFECKKSMICKKCKEIFKITADFLSGHRRKTEDN